MRPWIAPLFVAGLLMTPALASAEPTKAGGSCGQFGTSVEFASSPSEAAREAKKSEKLVFVLHVSGHFEDPRFT